MNRTKYYPIDLNTSEIMYAKSRDTLQYDKEVPEKDSNLWPNALKKLNDHMVASKNKCVRLLESDSEKEEDYEKEGREFSLRLTDKKKIPDVGDGKILKAFSRVIPLHGFRNTGQNKIEYFQAIKIDPEIIQIIKLATTSWVNEMQSEDHRADAERMFANFSDEHSDINATPVHLHAATREFLATISTALTYIDITKWDEDGQNNFSRWNKQIGEILKYNRPLRIGNLNFAQTIGKHAADFLCAFIETEILIFTKGRTLPARRIIALNKREKALEVENNYQTGWWAHAKVKRVRYRFQISCIYSPRRILLNGVGTMSFKVDYADASDMPPHHTQLGQRIPVDDLVGSLATYFEVRRVIYEEYDGEALEQCLTIAVGKRSPMSLTRNDHTTVPHTHSSGKSILEDTFNKENAPKFFEGKDKIDCCLAQGINMTTRQEIFDSKASLNKILQMGTRKTVPDNKQYVALKRVECLVPKITKTSSGQNIDWFALNLLAMIKRKDIIMAFKTGISTQALINDIVVPEMDTLMAIVSQDIIPTTNTATHTYGFFKRPVSQWFRMDELERELLSLCKKD